MNKKNIILGAFGLIIGSFSMFHYIIYDSWLGIVGWAFGLGIIVYNNILRRKEILEKYNKMSDKKKRLNGILKIVVWVILLISTIITIYLILTGRIKGGIFNLVTLLFITILQWETP